MPPLRPAHSTILLGALGCGLLLSALGLGYASPARAQTRRVVVDSFRGPQASRVRGHLLANLEDEPSIEVVSRDEVRDAARELGISRRNLREEDYAQVAEQLQITAFIRGRVGRARRRWSLRVTVINGADGMEIGASSWGGRTVASLGAIRRNAYDRLEEHLLAAQSPAPQAQYAAQEADTPWYSAGNSTEAPPIQAEEEEEEDEPSAAGRYRWLELSVLGGLLHRSMQATATVASPREMPGSGTTVEEVRDYTSGGAGHFEVGLQAEFYPGAVGDEQAVPWFGILATFRHSLFLATMGCRSGGRDAFGGCNAAQTLDIPTTQSEISVGARGRFRLGSGARPPELLFDIGYGQFSFALDEGSLRILERRSVIPPISYGYVHLGAGLRYEAVERWLTLGARAAYRLGLGVGVPAQQVWGVETTDVSGYSIALDLRSEATYVADGVFLGLSLEYFRFGVTWRGQTACIDGGADGCYDGSMITSVDAEEAWEPWPHGADVNDVTGGILDPVGDSYVRVSLAIGYALR